MYEADRDPAVQYRDGKSMSEGTSRIGQHFSVGLDFESLLIKFLYAVPVL
ncbi:uncharacterized protein RAG0_06085 [Rhynchosporium agropyri]|uniref:Uncharacterized protein n=2 Tax=Rhynchosporium TaxID=38037 RepID=A0A1E1MP08_RHYSE|nr:uncharacterized protein RAG0_06085 [Rhynchosporium agropyri]CZT50822.1 uncharacterized protein RSE6_11881 [Rhynchosporium secalis]